MAPTRIRCGDSVVATMLAMAAGAAAQCPSPQWLAGPGTAPGLQGSALATLLWDPDGPGPEPERLVVGGNITGAGNAAVANIATFDPASGWRPMGAGLNGEVRALALHNGSLYAAGAFTASGETPVQGVARWTGSAWESVGAPANVDAIATYAGQLMAGGDFGVMSWDGTTWQVFQGNVTGSFSTVLNPGRHVYALAVYGGDLIVGGHFSMAGPTPANCLARWDGSAWSSLRGGIFVPGNFTTAQHAVVRAFHVSGAKLYVGGTFEGTSATPGAGFGIEVPSPNIVAWNGSTFEALDGLCFSRWFEVRDQAVIGGTIYAVGSVPYLPSCGGIAASFVSRPTAGGAWAAGGVPNGGQSDVLDYYGDVLLGGHTIWRNSAFVELSTGVSDGIGSFAAGGGSLYAAGPQSAGAQLTGGVARWDGTAWHPIDFSATGGPARVLAWYNGAVYIGGDFTSAAGLNSGGLVRYDGIGFSTVGGAVSGQVRSMTIFNNSLVVSGAITSFGTLTTPNIASWDGSAWHTIGSGLNAPANALAVHDSALYAAGNFVAGNNIARFDGTAWTLVPGGFSAAPGALASYNGRLYAGGTFTQAGSALASRIASFDGVAWSEVGGGMNNIVYTLLPFNGRLYAAGSFQQAGLATSPGIAQWDGAAWSAVDGGLAPGSVAGALGTFNGDLLVGGSITATSRGPSFGWARLGCATTCYANCDGSTQPPILNVNDFTCFLNKYAAGDSYANCDNSTIPPVLNINDFTCFLNRYAAGCP